MIKNPTVCIITYKREDGLKYLLSALEKQSVKNFKVIVTDNEVNSKVAEVVDSSKLNISLFKEMQQGISHARNKCITEFLKTDSGGLVWIDDDEWPEHKNWLQELLNTQERSNADVVSSDVVSLPEDQSKAFLVKALYAKPLANKDGDIIRHFYTNNTLICRRVIEKVGLLDLFYNQTGSGDLDYSVRTKKAGFKAVYAKNAKVIELHPKSRSSLKWFALRGFRVGQGSTLVSVKNKGLTRTLLLLIPYAGYRFLDAIMILSKSLITLDKSKLYAGVLRLGSSLGTISGIFGFKYKEYKKK